MISKAILLFLCLFCVKAIAQDTLKTLELKGVTVEADPLYNYTIGSKIKKVDDRIAELYLSGNLSEILNSQTSVYMKDLGAPGQVSTISFRGTGAGHSAVFWNGININSLTLGQTDFSLVPLFAADQMSILYGSGGALLGSDAIGGSIHLNTSSKWALGVKSELGMNFGSFGLQRYRFKFSYGTSKWQHSTKFYVNSARNDFEASFRDTTYAQNNAEITNIGLLHKSEYRINRSQSLALDFWYNKMDRGLQPKVGDFFNQDELLDENLRLILNYYLSKNGFNFNLRSGVVNDFQRYNKTDEYGTIRWLASAEVDKKLSNELQFHAGINFRRITTDVDAYSEDLKESRIDAFAMMTYTPIPVLEISANLRQTFVESFSSPFTPSLGTKLSLLDNKKHSLQLNGLVSRSYKIPTFNDRYWNPGGNPDLKSEEGWSWEGGIDHTLITENISLSSGLGYYQMNINDWILWVPLGNIWSPDNVRKVKIRGIEWEEKIEIGVSKTKMQLGFQLGWVESLNQIAVQENDGTEGNQLPYTPEWKASGFFLAERGPFKITLNTNFVGERYTELSNTSRPLESFQLVDVGLGYNYTFTKVRGNINFSTYNLFDIKYQNFANRAMPGRSFQIGIQLQIDN